MKITYEELMNNLTYDRDSGVFTTLFSRGRATVGDIVGTINKDWYVQISIKGNREYAHRLAWLYEYGEYPKYHIDHINGCKSDNRIYNLRDVTDSENAKNRPKDKHNKNKDVGVCFRTDTNRWSANIHIDGKRISLGCFISYSDALDARKNAEVLYGFHTNHGRTQ